MKRISTLLICALALAFAGAATAQQAQPAQLQPSSAESAALETTTEEATVSGTVVSATSTQLVINTDAGTRMTFALDPTSTTRFAVNERVTVAYHTETGGTVHQVVRVAATQPAAVTPRADTDSRDYDSARLPATAGSLPLIGRLGLLAVGGAVAVRVARA
ncbi:MAG TPA: hypothetical protein VNB06_15855 [Thermoanaerobaculia bacterium]|nr:hypothetical protein [Thermoanaerobaculia bacterium]